MAIVSLPVTSTQRAAIAAGELVHLTAREALPKIVVGGAPESGREQQVHLVAGQGWSLFPFKLFRDYSVLDVGVTDTSYWGQYLYFFLGEPNWWAYRKNITPFVSPFRDWDSLSKTHAVIRVFGRAVLDQAGAHVFYRADDGVVIIRGEYRGPAAVNF